MNAYLGLALERQGRFAAAERALRRAVLVAPELTEARSRAGELALRLGIELGRAGDLAGASVTVNTSTVRISTMRPRPRKTFNRSPMPLATAHRRIKPQQ